MRAESEKIHYAILMGGPEDGRAIPNPGNREVILVPKMREVTWDPGELSPRASVQLETYNYRKQRIDGLPPSRVSIYVYENYLDWRNR